MGVGRSSEQQEEDDLELRREQAKVAEPTPFQPSGSDFAKAALGEPLLPRLKPKRSKVGS